MENAGGSGDSNSGEISGIIDIMEFSANTEVWKNIGKMSSKRRNHAVSVINFNSIKEYCTETTTFATYTTTELTATSYTKGNHVIIRVNFTSKYLTELLMGNI